MNKNKRAPISNRLSVGVAIALASSIWPSVSAGEASLKNFRGEVVSAVEIDSLLETLTREQEVPGVALAIVDTNGIVYQHTAGVANTQTGEPLRAESVFEVASLSKPIFAYYALRISEDAVIDLDKPLFEYLPHPGFVPEDVEAAKTINAKMVLSHTTGMPNWSKGKPMALSGTPGEVFAYSGEAFQFLTAAIGVHQEMGWGENLNTQIDEYVFSPLNMTSSSYVWNESLAANKVYGHKAGVPTDNASIGKGESVGGAYSMHSTIGDYAKFVEALLDRAGLSEENWTNMLSAQIALPEDHEGRELGQFAWSMGFAVKDTEQGNHFVHTGNNQDFQSYMEFDPEQGIGLVYFTNSDAGSDVYESISEIMGL